MKKFYIIGDPAVRDKVRFVFRTIGMALVLGFACIGFGVFLRAIVQICAW